jgi:ribosomal protein S27E
MAIQQKKKLCSQCGNEDFIWSKGKCKSCSSKPFVAVSKTTIDETREELNAFFESHIKILNSKPTKCENCNTLLFNPTSANIAHILPKSIFKSISTNNNNCMYLCLICHGNYDSSWDKAIKMQCFKKAREKFKLFEQYIIEKRDYLKYFYD